MPINILADQRQHAQVGRIRMGMSEPRPGSDYRKPVKLETFLLTTPRQDLIEQAQGIYGGTPERWKPQGGGAEQWRLLTDRTSLDVIVPPRAMTQWLEMWQGAVCKLRCDGINEVTQDRPCVCGPDPANRKCKPTTRVNLILAHMSTLGIWRLESHGFYAAVKIPPVVEYLQAMGGYQPAVLSTTEYSKKVEGESGTRRWFEPSLDVTQAPAAAIMGTGQHLGIEPVNAGRQAIAAAPAQAAPAAAQAAPAAAPVEPDADLTDRERGILEEIEQCNSRLDVQQLRARVASSGGGLSSALNAAFNQAWRSLPSATASPAPATTPAAPAPPVDEVQDAEIVPDPPAAPAHRTPTMNKQAALGPMVIAAGNKGMNNKALNEAFTAKFGHGIADGTTEEFQTMTAQLGG